MPSRPGRAAVCIIRVAVESWGLVITMTVNRDIAAASPEPAVRFTDTGEAVAAITTFLESLKREKQS